MVRFQTAASIPLYLSTTATRKQIKAQTPLKSPPAPATKTPGQCKRTAAAKGSFGGSS